MFVSWLAMLDSEMHQEASAAVKAVASIRQVNLPDDTVQSSEPLFYSLVLTMNDRALEMLKSVSGKGEFKGLMGLLHQVLNPKFSLVQGTWLDESMKWKSGMDRYHTISTEAEAILAAIIIQQAPSAIKQHLQLNASTLAHGYHKTRAAAESLVVSTRSWLGAASSEGPVPMEIDALWFKEQGKVSSTTARRATTNGRSRGTRTVAKMSGRKGSRRRRRAHRRTASKAAPKRRVT